MLFFITIHVGFEAGSLAELKAYRMARLAGYSKLPVISVPTLPALVHATGISVYVGAGDPNSGSYACLFTKLVHHSLVLDSALAVWSCPVHVARNVATLPR